MPNYIIVISIPPLDEAPIDEAARGWSLLRAGVPLSLLCDLAFSDGPPSREILTVEAVADDVARDLISLKESEATHPRGRSIQLPEVTISTA